MRHRLLPILLLIASTLACNIGQPPPIAASPTPDTVAVAAALTQTAAALTQPTSAVEPTQAVVDAPTVVEATAENTQAATEPPDLDPALQLALEGVSSNGQWQPHIETFDGIQMALVPAGCFTMGNNSGGDADERPGHEICFEAPFWIAVTEVTNAQYGSNGSFVGDNRPRDSLNWFDAQEFCQSRGERLPTEAEWEYAARGPDGLVYPWGQEFGTESRALTVENSGGLATDVGRKPQGASWVGALDMAGNLLEWTSSVYRPYPYSATDGRETTDHVGDANRRVIRGGGFNSEFYELRTTFRLWRDSNFGLEEIGFRCVRDADF